MRAGTRATMIVAGLLVLLVAMTPVLADTIARDASGSSTNLTRRAGGRG